MNQMENITIKRTYREYCPFEARSDIGGREEQQDNAYVKSEPHRLVAVVCDGMGGMNNGAQASEAAVSAVDRLASAPSEKPVPALLYDMLAAADAAVVQRFHSNDSGSTIVAAILQGGILYFASVGDSRLYIFRNGDLIQGTRDHNYFLRLNALLASNMIDQAVYDAESASGEALLNYLGSGNLDLYDLTPDGFRLKKGDLVLLTTDGLYRQLSKEEIAGILSSGTDLNELAETLLMSSLQKSSIYIQDNTTFILIRYEGES